LVGLERITCLATFQATSQYLADQKSYHEQTKIERESLEAAAAAELPSDFADEIEAHFEFMPTTIFAHPMLPKLFSISICFGSFFENPRLSSIGHWCRSELGSFSTIGNSIASFALGPSASSGENRGIVFGCSTHILSATFSRAKDHAILAVFRFAIRKDRPWPRDRTGSGGKHAASRARS